MNNYDNKIWVLITRVLSNEASSEEQKEFRRWLEEDRKHEEFFRELRSAWQEEPRQNLADSAFLFDYEQGLGKFRDKLRNNKQNKRLSPMSRGTLPQLPFRPGNVSAWKVAASILFVILLASVFIKVAYWKPETTAYLTKGNEQRIITLPDGSQVRLNKNSKIEFPSGLSGRSRVLTLTGEAFFEVVHNPDRPFIIHVGSAVIRDIGTSFNVKEEGHGKVVVAVKNGIVSLRNSKVDKERAAILKKDHVGVLTKNDSIQIAQTNIENYLSWISRRLVFKEMPFEEVITQLENIYNIKCQLRDPSLANLKLTAYTENPSLDEVLDMVSLSLQINYRKVGNTVIWMRK